MVLGAVAGELSILLLMNYRSDSVPAVLWGMVLAPDIVAGILGFRERTSRFQTRRHHAIALLCVGILLAILTFAYLIAT